MLWRNMRTWEAGCFHFGLTDIACIKIRQLFPYPAAIIAMSSWAEPLFIWVLEDKEKWKCNEITFTKKNLWEKCQSFCFFHNLLPFIFVQAIDFAWSRINIIKSCGLVLANIQKHTITTYWTISIFCAQFCHNFFSQIRWEQFKSLWPSENVVYTLLYYKSSHHRIKPQDHEFDRIEVLVLSAFDISTRKWMMKVLAGCTISFL